MCSPCTHAYDIRYIQYTILSLQPCNDWLPGRWWRSALLLLLRRLPWWRGTATTTTAAPCCISLLPRCAYRVLSRQHCLHLDAVRDGLEHLGDGAFVVPVRLVVAEPEHPPPLAFGVPCHLDDTAVVLLARLLHSVVSGDQSERLTAPTHRRRRRARQRTRSRSLPPTD